ncbi:hypothetical protein ACFO3O_07595 [Dokdonia ponticola]|uniref:Polysaccharide chain length determinant N-terminal domain-containing protein n=1 Tax=Dokdonia ponticola TaxID=2041041 RepID=A0ABV9HVJ9_9FLAO
MSAPQPASNVDQEMDLKDIFTLFQRTFYKFLALCFKAVDFTFKFWWIILLLIIAGATLGFFSKGKPTYRSEVVVQSNFDSQAYLYNAIKQFDENLSEKDSVFLRSVDLSIENIPIKSVEIKPVIDVMSLVEELKISDRTFGTIIKELEVNDEEELFASDRFYTNYKYHKLIIDLRSEEAKTEIAKVIDYVNNKPFIQRIKEERIQNIKERIKQNESIMVQSDALVESYTKSADLSSQISNEKLSFFNNSNTLNINGVLTFKNTLAIETEQLRNDLAESLDAVVVISDLQTAKQESFKDRKEIIYPVLFVFIFLFFAGVRYTYFSLRREVESQNLLD